MGGGEGGSPDYPGIRTTEGKFIGVGNIQNLPLSAELKFFKAENSNAVLSVYK